MVESKNDETLAQDDLKFNLNNTTHFSQMGAAITTLKTIVPKNEWEQEKDVQDNYDDWDVIDERVAAKYQMIQKMGKGNYGIVWKAIDNTNRDRVAIKKINNAFANKIDAIRTLREITILSQIGSHPNVLKLHTVQVAKNNKDIYLV